jgi:hypothetical protein
MPFRLCSSLPDPPPFPHKEPWYAIKCNPDPKLLHALLPLCPGYDCASAGEIETMLSLGVKPSWWALPFWEFAAPLSWP